jgi:hypothetical protein
MIISKNYLWAVQRWRKQFSSGPKNGSWNRVLTFSPRAVIFREKLIFIKKIIFEYQHGFVYFPGLPSRILHCSGRIPRVTCRHYHWKGFRKWISPKTSFSKEAVDRYFGEWSTPSLRNELAWLLCKASKMASKGVYPDNVIRPADSKEAMRRTRMQRQLQQKLILGD